MLKFIIGLILISQAFALEVVRPEFEDKLHLRIIRAEPDSFETYSLMNHNGREMTLICARNKVYDNNPMPMIRYRNYLGEEVGDFQIGSEQVCRELGKFIESSSFGIDEKRPLLMTLSKKKLSVDRIEYPNIDPYSDDGVISDLLPKKRIFINNRPAPKPLKRPDVM